jgi:hypothetical protein
VNICGCGAYPIKANLTANDETGLDGEFDVSEGRRTRKIRVAVSDGGTTVYDIPVRFIGRKAVFLSGIGKSHKAGCGPDLRGFLAELEQVR